MNTEWQEINPTTDSIAVAEMPADQPEVNRDREPTETTNKIVAVTKEGEALAPLFPPAIADGFRSQWAAVHRPEPALYCRQQRHLSSERTAVRQKGSWGSALSQDTI